MIHLIPNKTHRVEIKLMIITEHIFNRHVWEQKWYVKVGIVMRGKQQQSPVPRAYCYLEDFPGTVRAYQVADGGSARGRTPVLCVCVLCLYEREQPQWNKRHSYAVLTWEDKNKGKTRYVILCVNGCFLFK